ncbi:hypothetical protein C1646_768447 [Rhizophagus diaphanus]|nr:hypothetical protein C1646_768447 [Rhizophagus diaphanus] [Rhizophagus sp. MUCL 43196]
MWEKPEIISNTQVKNLLKNDEFFFMSQTISHIIDLIKDCILKLKARTAILADCYIQMLKLAATINRLPSSNTLKPAIIGIYNHHYQEFDHEAYLLSYYLILEYRRYRLNDKDKLDEYNFDDDTSEDFRSSDYAIGSISFDISLIANLDHTIFNGGHQVVQTNLNRDLIPDNLEYNVGNWLGPLYGISFLNGHMDFKFQILTSCESHF